LESQASDQTRLVFRFVFQIQIVIPKGTTTLMAVDRYLAVISHNSVPKACDNIFYVFMLNQQVAISTH